MTKPDFAEIDAEVEKIIGMTDAECLADGIAEYGSEEAWRAAMNKMRDSMLNVVEQRMTLIERLRNPAYVSLPGNAAMLHLQQTRATMDEAAMEIECLRVALSQAAEALKAVVRVADRKTVEFDMARAAIAKAELADGAAAEATKVREPQ